MLVMMLFIPPNCAGGDMGGGGGGTWKGLEGSTPDPWRCPYMLLMLFALADEFRVGAGAVCDLD
jgi:hypothetical protein